MAKLSAVKVRLNRYRMLIARLVLLGGALGLLLGLCEAAVLFAVARLRPLGHPTPGFSFWFLAPITDLLVWALLGLVIGLALVFCKDVKASAIATLIVGQVSLAGVYVLEILRKNSAVHHDLEALICAILFFAIPLAGLKMGWGHYRRYFDEVQSQPPRRLAIVVGAISTVLVMGLAVSLAPREWFGNATQASASPSTSAPNIILIVLDTVRADHLSAYGYRRPTTPNLDRLARQGVLFENAIAPTSWTLPSHASIFTGLLPHQHGADWHVPPYSNSVTLGGLLQSRGYETTGFFANTGFGPLKWGLGQGFGRYEDYTSSFRHNLDLTLVGRGVDGLFARLNPYYCVFDRSDAGDVNRDIHGWFEHRASRPFFLFINYFDAHAPYILRLAADQRRFGLLAAPLALDMQDSWENGFAGRFSEGERQHVVDGYDNTLAFLDDQIGKLFQFLARSPEWSKTIVIITSDHGEAFGEHGRFNHAWDLHREVLRVPLIMFGSGVPIGRRVASVVDIRDIFSTVLDLAQAQNPRMQGSSLRRFWPQAPHPARFDDFAVSEFYHNAAKARDGNDSISLMTNEWHYIHSSNGQIELYDWIDDPQEAHNLAGSAPEYERTAADLHARLCQAVVSSLDPLRGREYLGALNEPQSSSPGQTALGCGLASKLPPERPRPKSEEEELLYTLPYH